jgi:hybrid cluster-associated redox disulfide protein
MDATLAYRRITAESLVQEVVAQHPAAIPVFVGFGMGCVGCTISPFHTIADSAREHALPLEPLLGDLNRALQIGKPDP